jgi:hypothetical protein
VDQQSGSVIVDATSSTGELLETTSLVVFTGSLGVITNILPATTKVSIPLNNPHYTPPASSVGSSVESEAASSEDLTISLNDPVPGLATATLIS